MRPTRLIIRWLATASLLMTMPRLAAAQVSAEARLHATTHPIDLNPRLTFWPMGGGLHLLQLDVNAVYNLPPAENGHVLAYMGAGVALQNFDGGGAGSETHVGANLVSGFQLDFKRPLRPFLNFQYTATPNVTNIGVLSVGVIYQFPHGGGGAPSSAP